ncbi:MAG: epoxyqueuosine reductase QueH [Lachnospiraceae bacterium]|nr:epoxyqueuosine reductase QueH [Lachnospiraceae bacterium]
MNKRNYQKELDKIIEENREKGEKPSLLLHSCCAPCSSYPLKYLSGFFEITDLYYNPNITDKEEYEKRAGELKRLISVYNAERPREGSIKYIEESYEPALFFEMVKGLESAPEGGERCYICYEMRLRKAACLAREKQMDYFTTTLSISPLKNADRINEIGERLSGEYGVRHLPSDFKKKDGYKASVELSKKYGLYRQNYCGCAFSKASGVTCPGSS